MGGHWFWSGGFQKKLLDGGGAPQAPPQWETQISFLDLVSYKIRNEFSKNWVPIFVNPKALRLVKIGLD